MSRGRIGRHALSALVAVICLFLLLPTLAVIPVSFSDTDYITFPPPGLSMRWFAVFFSDPAWRHASLMSLLVATTSALLATALGTAAALGLARLPKRAARAVVWVVLLPLVVPSIIVAVALYGAFARLGLVGTVTGLVVAHCILTTPFVTINVSAVLQRTDSRLPDAARSLGASPAQAFRRVWLPAILPGMLAGGVFAFLTSFDEVVVSLFISGTDTITLPVQMWNGIRFEISPAVAAASTILLCLAVLLLAAFSLVRPAARAPRPSAETAPP